MSVESESVERVEHALVEEFFDAVGHAMVDKGIRSWTAVAKEAGVSKSHMSQLRAGSKSLTVRMAIRIASAVGLRVDFSLKEYTNEA